MKCWYRTRNDKWAEGRINTFEGATLTCIEPPFGETPFGLDDPHAIALRNAEIIFHGNGADITGMQQLKGKDDKHTYVLVSYQVAFIKPRELYKKSKKSKKEKS